MDKIKVRLSPLFLAHQQTITDWVDQARAQKLEYAAQAEYDLEDPTGEADRSGPELAGLLTPPWIECLHPVYYLLENGQTEGIVNLITSDLFGIVEISLTIWDGAGNLLEKGYAEPDEGCIGLWSYPCSVAPAVGTAVIVQAVAADPLGAMSIARETLTLTDKYLRTSTEQLEGSGNR